jgi:hypothetical protein
LHDEKRDMQESNTEPSARDCSCVDWQTNIPQLDSLLLLAATHRREYQGTPFRFCPWCGRSLIENSKQRDEVLLEKYRQRITADFFAGDEWGTPQMPNMLVAARPINDYRQMTGDILGTLDLMLTFVEEGTRYTNEYGDIDEPFYEGLELMLDDFRQLLLAHSNLYEEADLAQRLTKLLREAGPLGWGYGDYVTEQISEIQQFFGDV